MVKETNTKLPKIGIVDVQFLVNATPSVVALRQEQQGKLAALQQWVNTANGEIAKLSGEEEKKNLAQKYKVELSQRQQMMQLEYAQKVQNIDVELTNLIAKVAKEDGFDYVFAKGQVVFGATDLTPKIAAYLKK